MGKQIWRSTSTRNYFANNARLRHNCWIQKGTPAIKVSCWKLTLFRLGFWGMAQLGGGGGGGEVPVAYNSKTINGNEVKLGGKVKDH